MEKKIITISREFGSGGRTVGHLVAEKLGVPFYDKELVEHIALESGFAPSISRSMVNILPPAACFPMPLRPRAFPAL